MSFGGQFDEGRCAKPRNLTTSRKPSTNARKLNPMPEHSRCGQSAEGYGEFHPFGHRKKNPFNAPSETPSWKPKTDIPEATMKLPEGAPEIKAENPASTATEG